MGFYDFLNMVSEKYPVALMPEDFSSKILTDLELSDSLTQNDYYCDGWFCVGENASHTFYIRKGEDENSFFRCSSEYYWNEEGELVASAFVSKHDIQDIATVYLGHF